jgi:hypothetical protein
VADVRVDIVARVPPGVRVVASTFNGDVEVIGLGSVVEAGTANGRVRFLPSAPLLAAARPAEPRSTSGLNDRGA